jgi:multidrug efflux pump
MARFFIDRPIFAWVIALFVILIGTISIRQLPVAQYPQVAPPSVIITAIYPGASAKTLDETVVSIIENELNGAEHMIFMESVSQVNGQAQIAVTFAPGTDPALAQVDLQNRLARATPRLPAAVAQQGVRVERSNNNVMMIITLSSKDGRLTPLELGDYGSRNIMPELQRLPGVGTVRVFGSERAMRIWFDMHKLASLGLTPNDITTAIRTQNSQVSAGLIGDLPAIEGQATSATVVVNGQLTRTEDFGAIVLRANPDGSTVRLRDVARIELGGQNYATFARRNGAPSVGLAIQPSPSANALETSKAVNAKLKELSRYFPAGVEFYVPYDTSRFVSISITKVVETLFEAMLLVFLVMYLFLQNLRYTLIPAIVVPVALLGAFGAMFAIGFSINVLTMFAMVLAIGILVDDAIVVVENVERLMAEEKLSPRDATIKAMSQITGAVIGITVVLVSVFIPMAFFGGSVGAIYRQFSLTMSVSILLSAFLALSLTPALCATLLKPVNHDHDREKRGIFGAFNRVFFRTSERYHSTVTRMLSRTGRYLVVYAVIIAAVAVLVARLPTSFLPDEDQGLIVNVSQLPAGASAARTLEVAKKVEHFYLSQPEVENIVTVVGTSFFGAGQNMTMSFISLKDWDQREGNDHTAQAMVKRAFGNLSHLRDAFAVAMALPPILELGFGNGFMFRLQDRGGVGYERLLQARDQFMAAAHKNPILTDTRLETMEDAPQLQVDVDREQAYALGVDFAAINSALSVALGSSYVNDFPNAGRMQRVVVQADAIQRMQPEDLLKLQVANVHGQMVPLGAFAKTHWTTGSVQLIRYNTYPAIRVSGTASAGYTTGQAMAEIEKIMAQMPDGIGYEWTGLSREEKISGAQVPALMALSLLAVFLCLAALYESWSIPFAVLLAVPLGIIGSLLAATSLGMSNDVYFKVGLITIMGLSAKNAILIIEFARDLEARGHSLIEATLMACKQRFRPILMTSAAFILGVLPLAIATGAGSGGQRAIGIGVMGGMISATVLAVLMVPVFYVVIRRVITRQNVVPNNVAAGNKADSSEMTT